MFDTKVAIIVREDMAVWQKLNVTAFLATGIAAAAPDAIGLRYLDAAGRPHGAMIGQPMLIFAADRASLRAAHARAWAKGLTITAYVGAMFGTGHDAANRAVFAAEPADDLDLVGLGLRGPKKAVDKAIKSLSLHP
jgi:hypothetical protein